MKALLGLLVLRLTLAGVIGRPDSGTRLVDDAKVPSSAAGQLNTTGAQFGPGTLDPEAAAPKVTIFISQPFSGPQLAPKKFGGYRSEETNFWRKIYQPNKTLRPLNMPSNRVQISLWDAELGPNGEFVDPEGTQLGIIRSIAASVSDDIFVTVGYPWTNKSREFIKADFPPGWETYWRTTFTTLADKLAKTPYYTGKRMWIELFGEPDGWWWWDDSNGVKIYGTDRTTTFRAAKMAYDAFDRYRDRFRIGGMGWAFIFSDSNDNWIRTFLEYARQEGLAFDFFSIHSYLQWTDRTSPANYPFGEQGYRNLGYRLAQFNKLLQEMGVGSVPVVISEYSWADADGYGAAGCGPPEKSCRVAMTRWKNCARTLHAMDLVLREPSVARAYWAQGVGRLHSRTGEDVYRALPLGPGPRGSSAGSASGLRPQADCPWVHSYFPAVLYDQVKGNRWIYHASYYAFWFYGRMRGTRVAADVSLSSFGVWASKEGRQLWVAVWNKSLIPRFVNLAVPGAKASWPCKMYRVDDKTYLVSKGGADAVISGPQSPTPPIDRSVKTVGDALRVTAADPLAGEGTIFLDITMD